MANYYTKDQANRILSAWVATYQFAPVTLPKRGAKVTLAFPTALGPKRCTIVVHETRGTYGDLLYRFTFSS